jgi:hypothetical protein
VWPTPDGDLRVPEVVFSMISRKGTTLARRWIHTVHRNGVWVNEEEGKGTAISSHGTKEEAVARGRQVAEPRTTEHVIHNLDGTIAERNSYGNDPYPPPG